MSLTSNPTKFLLIFEFYIGPWNSFLDLWFRSFTSLCPRFICFRFLYDFLLSFQNHTQPEYIFSSLIFFCTFCKYFENNMTNLEFVTLNIKVETIKSKVGTFFCVNRVDKPEILFGIWELDLEVCLLDFLDFLHQFISKLFSIF